MNECTGIFFKNCHFKMITRGSLQKLVLEMFEKKDQIENAIFLLDKHSFFSYSNVVSLHPVHLYLIQTCIYNDIETSMFHLYHCS